MQVAATHRFMEPARLGNMLTALERAGDTLIQVGNQMKSFVNDVQGQMQSGPAIDED